MPQHLTSPAHFLVKDGKVGSQGRTGWRFSLSALRPNITVKTCSYPEPLQGGIAVPEFIPQPSDDQVALIVCFGAVVASGLIMHFSHHVGRLTGRIRLHETPDQTGLALDERQPVHLHQPGQTAAQERAA